MFNETAVKFWIQRNNYIRSTTTIIFTYNPLTLLSKGVIVYNTKLPFYFPSYSIQTLNLYTINYA